MSVRLKDVLTLTLLCFTTYFFSIAEAAEPVRKLLHQLDRRPIRPGDDQQVAVFADAVGILGRRRDRGLRHAFRELHGRGERRVLLGVDSENPTGATRLYERAGMHVEEEAVVVEKELA